METIYQLFQYLIHIDTTLVTLISTYGNWVYLALFAVIFCETGLVVTPFLPGDSLLFAAGSLAAQQGSGLQIQLLFVLLCIAATLGNKVNYLIGRLIGPRVFTAKDSWLLNKRHLQEAHTFYEKHGGKTIIFARFLPIIRTFVPFVAGVGGMSLSKFSFYNMISGVLWIGSLLYAGFFFGSIPLIKNNFTIVIYAIIAISLLPVAFAVISRKLSPNS
jgi:membrane-associated protein